MNPSESAGTQLEAPHFPQAPPGKGSVWAALILGGAGVLAFGGLLAWIIVDTVRWLWSFQTNESSCDPFCSELTLWGLVLVGAALFGVGVLFALSAVVLRWGLRARVDAVKGA